MTEHTNAAPQLACYVVMRQDDKIAFVLRENTSWMNDHYSLPAGRVEWGETVAEGAVREAKEEAGVTISTTELRHLLTVHRHGEDADWIDVYFEAMSWEGELVNAEPDQHSAAVWLDKDNLPDNIIPPQHDAINKIAAGITYAEYGW